MFRGAHQQQKLYCMEHYNFKNLATSKQTMRRKTSLFLKNFFCLKLAEQKLFKNTLKLSGYRNIQLFYDKNSFFFYKNILKKYLFVVLTGALNRFLLKTFLLFDSASRTERWIHILNARTHSFFKKANLIQFFNINTNMLVLNHTKLKGRVIDYTVRMTGFYKFTAFLQH